MYTNKERLSYVVSWDTLIHNLGHEKYFYFVIVTEVAMGHYGDWNWTLKKAIDEVDGISENSSQVDLRGLENKEKNGQISTISFLKNKLTIKPSTQQVSRIQKVQMDMI